MTIETTNFRGNPTYKDSYNVIRYADTNQPTATTWKDRSCGHCLKPNRPDEHYACLGELPADLVMNACCGHGSINDAYIQYWDYSQDDGQKALDPFEQLKNIKPQ